MLSRKTQDFISFSNNDTHSRFNNYKNSKIEHCYKIPSKVYYASDTERNALHTFHLHLGQFQWSRFFHSQRADKDCSNGMWLINIKWEFQYYSLSFLAWMLCYIYKKPCIECCKNYFQVFVLVFMVLVSCLWFYLMTILCLRLAISHF